MVVSVLIAIFFELFLPLLFGALFALPSEKEDKAVGKLLILAKSYAYGQILLFAIFEPAAVFAVVRGIEFPYLVRVYLAAVALITIVFWVFILTKKKSGLRGFVKTKFDNFTLPGVIAGLLLVFMIVMSFFITYVDGDDAFYIAASADALSSESLFIKNPYTGFPTDLLFRYIFAPFPLWISFIAKVAGLNLAALAHTFFPWSMILHAFSVMYILADLVCDGDRKKRGLFMLFASLLILFGDYSIYSPANFLLARSRQGKAALATFVIPFLLIILYSSFKEMEEKNKISCMNLLFVFASGFAAALCSTMGGVLSIALTFMAAFFMMITYRKLKYPALLALFSLPCLVFAAMYLILR